MMDQNGLKKSAAPSQSFTFKTVSSKLFQHRKKTKKKETTGPSACTQCGKEFSFRKGMYAHMRAAHNTNPTFSTGKMICPADCCQEVFGSLAMMRRHLSELHEVEVESECHQFETLDDFYSWRGDFQTRTGSFFRLRYTDKPSKTQNIRRTVLLCSKSNLFKSHSMGLRHRGWKPETTCPASITVDRPLLENGPVTVTVWKTHLGHEMEPLYEMDCEEGIAVILPAAGKGERMGMGGEAKQFMMIRNKPVIQHTVEAFLKMSMIDQVIVVTDPDNILNMLSLLAPSTDASIKAGIDALKSSGTLPRFVVIHDAVRPFVSEDLVSQVVAYADIAGAAGLVCPLVSTVVKRNADQMLEESLDRSQYWASEMPQAFRASTIVKAYEECSAEDLVTGTECLQLVLKYCGIRAKLIQAPEHLWKITHSKDIFAAEGFLKANESVAIVSAYNNPELVQPLRLELKKTFREVHLTPTLTQSILPNFPNWVVLDTFHLKTLECRLTRPTSVVVLYGHMFNSPFDVKDLKKMNLFVYFVKKPYIREIAKIEEWARVVTSLLKDSNPYICGTAFS